MVEWMDKYKLTPDNPPNDGIMFANLQPQGRSSHLGHALVEYEPGKVLAFYPNCSAIDNRWKGHSGHGWMEYERSTDGGRTWSEPIIEPNSRALYDRTDGKRTMACEKAVCTPDGAIVLFYLTCDMTVNGHIWEPFFEPRYAVSRDGGETFSQTKVLVHDAGRIFDAICRDGIIYVLFHANAALPAFGYDRSFPYYLYVSEDGGESFELRSTLAFDNTANCLYGTMEFTPEGKLITYIYDEHDENNLRYVVSEDEGHSWGICRRAFFAKKLRNPQLVYFGGSWWIHGRSGNRGEGSGNFILYHSKDGIHWDEGQFLQMRQAWTGEYSNNLIVHCPDGKERLLIQASHAYELNKTNVVMWWLEER